MSEPTLFDMLVENLVVQAEQLATQVATLPLAQQVEALNRIRQELHQVSPFKSEPVDCVLWISKEQVEPNGYNPNDVAPPEMRLLEVSIHHDGYTQPVVGYPLSDVITRLSNDGMSLTEIADYLVEDIDTIVRFAGLANGQIVVDGEHRSIIGKTKKRIAKRVFDYLPVASLQREHIHPNDRMAGTIRHNRARGVHAVEPMADIVATLIRRGWTDDEVARELGMDADEVLRFKQNVGLPELFKTHDYSRAWR